MSTINEEVTITWEFIHPEYPARTEIELTFVVDLCWEGPDPSVGIMSGSLCEDGWILNTAVLLDNEDGKDNVIMDTKLIEQLYPEDIWDELIKNMVDCAIDQGYSANEDSY